MKKTFLFIIFFLIIVNCLLAQKKTPASPFNFKDSTTIKGKITGFKPGQEDGFISITVYDILGDSKKRSFQINNDGTFSATFYQQFEGDVTFQYRSAFISFYTVPGKTLTLAIDDGLINRETGHKDAILASGDEGTLNNIMLQFQTADLTHTYQTEADLGDKSLNDTAFANQKLKLVKEQIALLGDFVKTNNISNKTFVDWQRNQFIYEAGKEILFRPFLGKINREITLLQFAQLYKNIPVDNTAALHNSAYYDFLQQVGGGQQIIINVNPAYDEQKKADGFNSVPLYLAQIKGASTGIARELLYHSLYQQYGRRNKQKLPDLSSAEITDPYLKAQVDLLNAGSAEFKAYAITDKIRSLSINDTLKTRLVKLFSELKGSDLHLDFWGDWCGPCMLEMPNYPKTIARFKDKGLKFVFLSAFTKQESMLAVKAKFGIDAEFINLSNNEVAVLNDAFDFHSYPSHFIINAQGLVTANHTRSADQIAEVLAKKQ